MYNMAEQATALRPGLKKGLDGETFYGCVIDGHECITGVYHINGSQLCTQ